MCKPQMFPFAFLNTVKLCKVNKRFKGRVMYSSFHE